MNSSPKLLKSTLAISLVTLGLLASGAASASAVFNVNVCIDTSGISESGQYDIIGNGSWTMNLLPVANYTFGGGMVGQCAGGSAAYTAKDSTGNWSKQAVGYAANWPFTVTSPTIKYHNATGGLDRSCSASTALIWYVNKINGDKSRNFVLYSAKPLQLHISGSLANNTLTCTLTN